MKIQIDFTKECIPSLYSEFKGVKRNVVSNWIVRGKIDVRKLDILKLTLVKIPKEEQVKFKNWVKPYLR
jgi:hypothetical protein